MHYLASCRFPQLPRILILSWLLLAVALIGCRKQQKPTEDPKPNRPSKPLNILVVDDQPLAEGIRRRWQAEAESQINVRSITWEELETSTKLDADVVIYADCLLGEMAERNWIDPLPKQIAQGKSLGSRDIFPLMRFQVASWGGRLFAVPLGSPQLVLYYRADLFEKLEIQPPQTWEEYQDLTVRLGDRKLLGELAPPADQPWSAVAEPLGEGWAGVTLLARAATYARIQGRYSTIFDFDSMKPLIEGPAFVRALKELVEANKGAEKESRASSPDDARQAFYAGHCAMAWSWPSRAVRLSDAESLDRLSIGFAELPGSKQAFNVSTDKWTPRPDDESQHVPLLAVAGRLGSVARQCKYPRAAQDLLLWLAARERGAEISGNSGSTTMFRASQINSAQDWVERQAKGVAGQYAEMLQQAQGRDLWLFSIRIPGRRQYLDALDKAVQRALEGKATPEEALTEAAQRWQTITKERGLADQRRAYQRSLGLED